MGREPDYIANGHEVKLLLKDEPTNTTYGGQSAWLNGRAVYIMDAAEAMADGHPSYPDFLAEVFEDVTQKSDVTKRHVHVLVSYMADTDQYICRSCGGLFDMDNAVKYGFCDVKCGACAKAAKTCTDGGSHEWKCLNPHQKRNARVPTKYKCTKCGKKRQTVPTG